MKGFGFVLGGAIGMVMSMVWFIAGGVCSAVVCAKAFSYKEKETNK